jgi:predicted histone-like DNA-binding protein
MAIKYSITRHKNPADPASPTLYYPTLKASGRLDLDRVATLISQISCVPQTTTQAVLSALLVVVPREMADGYIVELGQFGTFRPTLHTRGATSREAVVKNNILKVKARFRPGKKFRKALAAAEFKRGVPIGKPPRR